MIKDKQFHDWFNKLNLPPSSTYHRSTLRVLLAECWNAAIATQLTNQKETNHDDTI